MQWARLLGETGNEYVINVLRTSEGKVIVAANSLSYSSSLKTIVLKF